MLNFQKKAVHMRRMVLALRLANISIRILFELSGGKLISRVYFCFVEECGAVESVKAASEIFCPVTGKIVAANEALTDKPGLVNSSCYDEGL